VRARRGFTLLEVILATLIFAMSATAIGLTFRNVLLAHIISRETANLREELSLTRQEVQYMSQREDVEQGGEVLLDTDRMARWDAEVEETEVPDLYAVTLTVQVKATQAGEEDSQVSEVFYLLRPSWADGVRQSAIQTDFEDKLRSYREDQQWGWEYP